MIWKRALYVIPLCESTAYVSLTYGSQGNWDQGAGMGLFLVGVWGGRGCVCFLMSLLKELPTLVLPVFVQLLLVAPQMNQ